MPSHGWLKAMLNEPSANTEKTVSQTPSHGWLKSELNKNTSTAPTTSGNVMQGFREAEKNTVVPQRTMADMKANLDIAKEQLQRLLPGYGSASYGSRTPVPITEQTQKEIAGARARIQRLEEEYREADGRGGGGRVGRGLYGTDGSAPVYRQPGLPAETASFPSHAPGTDGAFLSGEQQKAVWKKELEEAFLNYQIEKAEEAYHAEVVKRGGLGYNGTDTKTGDGEKSVWQKALKQILLGNYTDDVTLAGTAGQVGLSLAGLDLPCDIRDLTYDLTHWEWTPEHLFQTAVDLIGFLPLVGGLKYVDEANALLKNADEAGALFKGALKNADELGTAAKQGDELAAAAKQAEKAVSPAAEGFEHADEAEKFLRPTSQALEEELVKPAKIIRLFRSGTLNC